MYLKIKGGILIPWPEMLTLAVCDPIIYLGPESQPLSLLGHAPWSSLRLEVYQPRLPSLRSRHSPAASTIAQLRPLVLAPDTEHISLNCDTEPYLRDADVIEGPKT